MMGHPAASVAWLANQLAAKGEGLRAGQLVFSGGVAAPVPVVAGGSVTFQLVAWGRSKWPAPDVWEERQSRRYRLSFGIPLEVCRSSRRGDGVVAVVGASGV